MPIRAVLWDFGGVILESPFNGFDRYEQEAGLPSGFLRSLNASNPDNNAWARMERNEVSREEFSVHFEAEAAAAGHRIDARAILGLLSGQPRPAVVEAVRRCAARLPTGLLTNNFVVKDAAMAGGRPDLEEILGLFHVIIESSKVGLRKPDPRIYELATEALGVSPRETVFLDDLGINLKPARAMGMTTIKVVDPDEALDQLEAAIGFSVRG
jgi:putative hydrolase of the HAD superfamily